MNSPSRQCDLEPFEFPFTQFLYDVFAPLLMPGIATETAAVLDPTQGWGDNGGPTGPLVHWLRAAVPLANADGASRTAGTHSPAAMATAASPGTKRRLGRTRDFSDRNTRPMDMTAKVTSRTNGRVRCKHANRKRDIATPPNLAYARSPDPGKCELIMFPSCHGGEA